MEEIDRTRLLPKSGVGVVSPWLVIAPAGNPVIRLDLRVLDSVERFIEDEDTDGSELLLCCGDYSVGIHIADGPEAAAALVREAQLVVGRDAVEPVMTVGHDVVRQDGDLLVIGSMRFRIGEVREYALRGANLPLTGGRMVQAAMALFVVAASERAIEL